MDHIAKQRKQLFTKNLIKSLLNHSISKLSFDNIRTDFERYFNAFIRDNIDSYDSNLINVVLKQRFERFVSNPGLVLDDEKLELSLIDSYTCVRFDQKSDNVQNNFLKMMTDTPLSQPYSFEAILSFTSKEDLFLDILRAQFAINYFGRIYFSASYLIKNRKTDKKTELELLRFKNETNQAEIFSVVLKAMYPTLDKYLRENFSVCEDLSA